MSATGPAPSGSDEPPDPATLDACADALRRARTVTVLTGAGMSADSGVPTFRDPDGIWAHHRPEDVATPEAFARDPQGVWDWYAARRAQMEGVEPHAGHRALAELEARVPDLRLVTQNIDGLHQRAGNTDVVEFHGSLLRDRCHYEGIVVDVGDGPAVLLVHGTPTWSFLYRRLIDDLKQDHRVIAPDLLARLRAVAVAVARARRRVVVRRGRASPSRASASAGWVDARRGRG